MRENRKHITRVTRDEARRLKDETDDTRLDAMADADIAQAVADDPDAAPIDLDWTQARLTLPPGKDVVTLRIDRDLLDWFRIQGAGYQTRINQVLRAFYEARRNPPAAALVEGLKERRGGAAGAQAGLEDPLFELTRLVEASWLAPAPSSAAMKKRRAAKPTAKAKVAKRRA